MSACFSTGEKGIFAAMRHVKARPHAGMDGQAAFPDLSSKSVLHFNQINQFHPVVHGAARLVETIYRPELKAASR